MFCSSQVIPLRDPSTPPLILSHHDQLLSVWTKSIEFCKKCQNWNNTSKITPIVVVVVYVCTQSMTFHTHIRRSYATKSQKLCIWVVFCLNFSINLIWILLGCSVIWLAFCLDVHWFGLHFAWISHDLAWIFIDLVWILFGFPVIWLGFCLDFQWFGLDSQWSGLNFAWIFIDLIWMCNDFVWVCSDFAWISFGFPMIWFGFSVICHGFSVI